MPTPSSQSVRCPVAHAQVVNRTLRRAGQRSGQTGRAKPAIDRPMRHWLNTFHQLHTEGATYTPVALRLDTDAVHRDGDVANGCTIGSAAQLAINRFVHEVALRRDSRGETWVLIMWEVDVPGIQFCDCADRDEAMALFAEPTRAIGRWHGVRLRPESRPW